MPCGGSTRPRWRRAPVGSPASSEPTLSVSAVDAAIDEIAAVHGAGSQARRRALVHALYAAATATSNAC